MFIMPYNIITKYTLSHQSSSSHSTSEMLFCIAIRAKLLFDFKILVLECDVSKICYLTTYASML